MRVAICLAALALGCQPPAPFECQTDSACSGGTCEPTGYCSFADPTCASGKRYGELAAPGLSAECVGASAELSDAAEPDAAEPDVPPAPDAHLDPLAALSDDFAASTLSGWQTVRPELVGSSMVDGALVVEPVEETVWFNHRTGFMFFKRVSGDFRLVGRVRARRMSSPSEEVWANTHFAGFLARAEGAPAESYVAVLIGKDEDVSVETKTTVAGVTTYGGPSWPAAEAELGLCRVGSRFLLLKRPMAGGNWALAAAYDRTDLPAELQVGPGILAAGTSRDLRAVFEEVTFSEVSTEADCLR
jgi:hypothetical protein